MRVIVVPVLFAACYTSRPAPPPYDPTPPPQSNSPRPNDDPPPGQTFATPPPGNQPSSTTVLAKLSTVGPDCQTCPPTRPLCPIGTCPDGIHQQGCGGCVKFANGQCNWTHLSCPAASQQRACTAADCMLPVPSAWLCPDGVTVTEYECVPTAQGACGATFRPCPPAARITPKPNPLPPPPQPPPPPPNPHPCDPLPSDKVLATWTVQDWCDPCCGPAPPPQREFKKLADGTRILEARGQCMRVKYRVCSHNKCLPPNARIATPFGDVAVGDLYVGAPVWTRGEHGERVAGFVVRVASTVVDGEHHVARVTLADARVLIASPEHPVLGGARIGELAIGDRYDGTTIVGLEFVPYTEARTYDVLPSGTGVYWADGVPVRSTLE